MPIYTWLQRNQIAVLGVALLVLGAGLAVDLLGRDHAPGIEFAYSSGVADGSPIRVQLAGAVARPGVYDLREGDRLVDAIAAAGGPAANADLDPLDMARRVRDEERIDVPAKSGGGSSAPTLVPGAKLDINTATQAQLEALPAIGQAYAQRIVDSRKVDGPYKATKDLVDRKVIPSAVLDQIRDLITVAP
ncbi:MAG TPA: ComEA family DNA-binding protein [Dehalococcoidia bacterium]